MDTKSWYTSKTVWLSVIQTLIGALALVATLLDAGDFTAAAVTNLVIGVLQIVIRVWFTDTGIAH